MNVCAECLHRKARHSNLGCSQCECALVFGEVEAMLINGTNKDPMWLDHEGYPRDMTEYEQAQHDRKIEAKRLADHMASSTLVFGKRMGEMQMRSAFEALDVASLKIGDAIALRGVDGKIVKAGLGQTSVGVAEAIDPVSGLVTVRLGG